MAGENAGPDGTATARWPVTGAGPPVVRVRSVLPAPPAEVFTAWTDPEQLRVWLCPEPGSVGHAECDPRVGGSFLVVMVFDYGAIRHTGEYLVVDPPHHIAFTWRSVSTGDADSTVDVRLEPAGAGETLMTIEHRGLPSDTMPGHQTGWTSIATRLTAALR